MILFCEICHTVKNKVDMKDKDICESCFYLTQGGVNPADSLNKETINSVSKAGGLREPGLPARSRGKEHFFKWR